MNECILVVDDDPEIVRAIAILLEKEGYQVLKAYNGMEALEQAVNPALRLIVIDVMMPKLDGLSAVMKIREKRNLPIIVLSAKSEVMSATIWDLPSAILTTQTRPLPPGCSSRTPPRFRTAVYIPLRLSIPSRNFSPQKGNIGWMENILKTPLTVWTEAPETGSTTAI